MAETNGPSKEEFEEFLAEHGEDVFAKKRIDASIKKRKARWEAKGGDFKQQIKHAFDLSQLTPEELREMLSARSQGEAWSGFATVTEEGGQISFTATFDQKPPVEHGFGGAPLGSRLSLGRARADGYNTAIHGGSLAGCPVPAESEEAVAWAKGFGEGLEDRVEPPPRPRRPGKTATEEMAEAAGAMPLSDSEVAVLDAERRRRGRPAKVQEADIGAALHAEVSGGSAKH